MTQSLLPIFDGHNDTLLKLYERGQHGPVSFFERSSEGHLDLPRAREGGFAGGLFAVFIPAHPATRPPPGSDLTIIPGVGYDVRMAESLDFAYAQQMALALSGKNDRDTPNSVGALGGGSSDAGKVAPTPSTTTRSIRPAA